MESLRLRLLRNLHLARRRQSTACTTATALANRLRAKPATVSSILFTLWRTERVGRGLFGRPRGTHYKGGNEYFAVTP